MSPAQGLPAASLADGEGDSGSRGAGSSAVLQISGGWEQLEGAGPPSTIMPSRWTGFGPWPPRTEVQNQEDPRRLTSGLGTQGRPAGTYAPGLSFLVCTTGAISVSGLSGGQMHT